MRVEVLKVRSLGQTTEKDLLHSGQEALQGVLVAYPCVGVRMLVRLPDGQLWRTSAVQRVVGSVRRAEVWTRHTVYQVRWVD